MQAGWTEEDAIVYTSLWHKGLEGVKGAALLAQNKCDLTNGLADLPADVSSTFVTSISVSAVTGAGLAHLQDAIIECAGLPQSVPGTRWSLATSLME
jgi:hypothetical protein